jgi:hypothetical protein
MGRLVEETFLEVPAIRVLNSLSKRDGCFETEFAAGWVDITKEIMSAHAELACIERKLEQWGKALDDPGGRWHDPTRDFQPWGSTPDHLGQDAKGLAVREVLAAQDVALPALTLFCRSQVSLGHIIDVHIVLTTIKV